MLAVCGVQCTSCTECDLVLVACITNAAPILTELNRNICMAEHMALGVAMNKCKVSNLKSFSIMDCTITCMSGGGKQIGQLIANVSVLDVGHKN